MKKILFLTLITCLLTLTAFAQNKTDFSGDWELDTVRSKMDERMRVESMTMKVAQTEKELKVETTAKRSMSSDGSGMNRGGGGGTQTLTYSLDGKETKAEVGGGMMAGTATLKASLESDGKLKLSSTREINTQMGATTIKTNETWELSNEGKTLKISRETESPRGKNSSELVFARKNMANDSGDPSDGKTTPGSTSSAPVPNMISGGVLNSRATNLVKPEYPAAARAVRVSGAVNVQVTIDENGDVISASAVSGHPLLRPAAEKAAKESKFSRTLLEGKPVKLSGIIVYNFVAP